MNVPSGIRTRCPIGEPHIHLAALDIGQIHLEKVGSLDRRLLGVGEPTASSGKRDPAINAKNGNLIIRCIDPSRSYFLVK